MGIEQTLRTFVVKTEGRWEDQLKAFLILEEKRLDELKAVLAGAGKRAPRLSEKEETFLKRLAEWLYHVSKQDTTYAP